MNNENFHVAGLDRDTTDHWNINTQIHNFLKPEIHGSALMCIVHIYALDRDLETFRSLSRSSYRVHICDVEIDKRNLKQKPVEEMMQTIGNLYAFSDNLKLKISKFLKR